MIRKLSLYFVGVVLLALGAWVGHNSTQSPSPQAIAADVAGHLQEQIQRLYKEAKSRVDALKDGAVGLKSSSDFGFFYYENDELISWSNNKFVPSARMVVDTFSIKWLKAPSGDYLVKKWPLGKRTFLIGLIYLHRHFPITNEYLKPNWDRDVFPAMNAEIAEVDSPETVNVCLSTGECLFSIKATNEAWIGHKGSRVLSVFLIVTGLCWIIYLAFNHSANFREQYPDLFLLIMGIMLWLIRWVMTRIDFPGAILQHPFFDPQNFASSSLNRSLGDLLLNELSLLLICYYIFKTYYKFHLVKWIYQLKSFRWIVLIFLALAYFFSFLFPFVVIQTVYNNSSIVLDISQSLQLDGLRVVAFFSVIVTWICSFLFGHVLIRLLADLGSTRIIILSVLAGMVCFMAINELTGQLYGSTLLVGSLYFALVYSLQFYKTFTKVKYNTFAYFFVAIIAFAADSAVTVHQFTRKEKIQNQFRFASNFLIDRDYFTEYLLQEVAANIAKDAFIQSRIVSPFLSKEAIRQKVRQVFLSNYFNKYDVDILLFGPDGHPISNRLPNSFSEVLSQYDREAFKTEYENVFFISSPAADVTQRYLTVSPISKSGVPAGYVVLQLLLKKVIPDNVYPELLVDNRFQQFYRTHDLSYAVYGKNLLYSSGEFNYELNFKREFLGNPDIHLKGMVKEGYIHVAVDDGSSRAAVVSSPVTPAVYLMANFSFLLVVGLAVFVAFLLIYGAIRLAQGHSLFFSARIQLVLNLAFFVPLIVVSITTLRLTSISSQEQLDDEYLNKSRSFGSQVEVILDDYFNSSDVNRIDFENQLTDLARLFNLDANVYSTGGRLLASSQPLIFQNGLIAPYINPRAFQKIMEGEKLFTTTESIGDLNYYVSVAALKSTKTGAEIGILALPFFQSLESLERIQTRVLTNILNIFAGIFIVLIILSYFVSEWLTFPLKFITRSLSKTSLTQANQPLKWKADDEIGMMVKEYNQMLYKLSESKAELEQTQRERAWREIAQQVAHEIKNPLTPMKLTLQQLERGIQSGMDAKDKVNKAVTSLLSQVDTLNDIASSFSSFAKMPEPNIQRLDMVALIRRIIDLHSQSGIIHSKLPGQPVWVMGDEQLLGRIFSNLILNGFQAARPGVESYVQVSILHPDQNKYGQIIVEDNGKGIEGKVADRVFVPYFTTKQSGSGLGLAISKQGIEQMKGKIWFETEVGKGTKFIIQLPLAEI